MKIETLSTDTDCDCFSTTVNGCAAGSVVNSTDYGGITINFNSGNKRRFTPLRGTATASTVTFKAADDADKTLGVRVSGLGRIRVCLPADSTFVTDNGDC
jgi:hypothetical protein